MELIFVQNLNAVGHVHPFASSKPKLQKFLKKHVRSYHTRNLRKIIENDIYSQKSVQTIWSSKENIPNEKKTQSKQFEWPLQNIEVLSFSGSPLQSTNLIIDKMCNTKSFPNILKETKDRKCLPYINVDSAKSYPCPNCPYFSTKKNDLNTHMSASHRTNLTYEQNTNFEDFIESCELPYLESPQNQIQISEIIKNQDS